MMHDSLGAITWWGFSPSLNLMDFVDTNNNDCGVINILLIGAGDLRHMLYTLSRFYREQMPYKLHFYILESSLELYARHMLFFTLAVEKQERMGLQEKSELFLETYGNILIRQQTADYIRTSANLFVRFITDLDFMKEKLPFLDCSHLKYKERDFLEGLFKLWRNPEYNQFDVEKYWDIRMRKIMATRYDSRMNTYDWDYHMRLCDRQGDVIDRVNYRRWRHTGQAFEIRDGTYDVPNKTIASGFILRNQEGEKTIRRGYWGDMIVSPYVALALQSEDKTLFTKQNGVFVKTSQDIAAHNVTAMFYEITNQTKYETKQETDLKPGCKLTEITEEDEESVENLEETTSKHLDNLSLQNENEFMKLDDIQVTFLPLNSLPELPKKAKFSNLFDIVYFSNSMVHLLTTDVSAIFKDKAKVIVESAKFMLELHKEQYINYVTKVTEMAANAHCQPIHEINAEKDIFLQFIHSRESQDKRS